MFHQSNAAMRRETPPIGYVAGAVIASIQSVSFATNPYAAGEKIEFGVLPAGARISRVRLVGEGIGTPNLTAGFLSGDPGERNEARVLGTELLNAAAVTDGADLTVPAKTLLAIQPDDTAHRAIGVTLSAAVAAGAGKKLSLVVEYFY